MKGAHIDADGVGFNPHSTSNIEHSTFNGEMEGFALL
jgi:hypothetical protein